MREPALVRYNQLMDSDSPFLDLHTQLSQCTTNDEVWQRIKKHATKLGIAAINIAGVEVGTGAPLWALSSMPKDWLEHYLREGYMDSDPFLGSFTCSRVLTRADCGTMTGADTGDKKALGLNHGLRDAGYTVLNSLKFQRPGESTGKLVSLGFCEDGCKPDLTPELVSFASLAAASVVRPRKGNEDLIPVPRAVYLSPRQTEVLQHLASGKQVAQIADAIGISETMVHRHMAHAKTKLGAVSREEALARGIRAGLVAV